MMMMMKAVLMTFITFLNSNGPGQQILIPVLVQGQHDVIRSRPDQYNHNIIAYKNNQFSPLCYSANK